MRMNSLALGLLFCLPGFTFAQFAAVPSQSARPRAAIELMLPLLQKSAQTWIDKQTCSSCHHHRTAGATR